MISREEASVFRAWRTERVVGIRDIVSLEFRRAHIEGLDVAVF